MHSKLIVLKSLTESDLEIETMLETYWLSNEINLSERYDIDYYTEIDITPAVDILKYNFPTGFKFDSNTGIATITLRGVVKYLYGRIREINSFMLENKPLDMFVDRLYSLQLSVQPDHPKILTTYFGIYDMIDTARSFYKRMRSDHIEKIEYEVYKCYDYHF